MTATLALLLRLCLTLCPSVANGFDDGDATFVDAWGFEVDWREPDDGWDEAKRHSLRAIHTQNEMQPTWVPAFTELGFLKMSTPKQLQEFMLEQRRTFDLKEEKCLPSAHQNCDKLTKGNKTAKSATGRTEMVSLWEADLFRSVVLDKLKPIAEEWSGVELAPSEVYGIRRYKRGAWLMLHVDRLSTHVVSVILQIDQKVDEDWPLLLVDLQGNSREVTLKPGEMLLYESAKVPHGRQKPLNGSYYDNVFVHFRPKKTWYESEAKPDQLLTKADLI